MLYILLAHPMFIPHRIVIHTTNNLLNNYTNLKTLSIHSQTSSTSLLSPKQISTPTLPQSIPNDHTLFLVHQGLETEYRILEIELNLLKSGYHEDSYTHRTEEQRYSGR